MPISWDRMLGGSAAAPIFSSAMSAYVLEPEEEPAEETAHAP